MFNAVNQTGFQSNIIDNIKRETTNDYNTHCTVKPLSLIEKLVELIIPKDENNILIDPFLGSGTTAIACKKLGISFIGNFELSL